MFQRMLGRKEAGRVVVLADDEAGFANDFRSAAEAAGFSVITYSTAESFISALQENAQMAAHLFVFDIQMEDEEAGFRALETLKARPEYRGSAAIIVSQSVRREDVCGSYQRGASLFIRKSRSSRANRKSIGELFAFLTREEVRFCGNDEAHR